MKSKYWIILLAALTALCFVSAFLLYPASGAELVRIRSGSSTMTISLREDQELTFRSDNGGYNTVTVKDGKIAVTAADCPDHTCIKQGFCSGGTPIVCLPHGLVIEFLDEQEIDGLSG